MDTSNSTNVSMADFIIGERKILREPTAEEWTEVLLHACNRMRGEMKYLGLREPRDLGDHNSYSLVARDVTDLGNRRIIEVCGEHMMLFVFLSESMEWLVAEAKQDFSGLLCWDWFSNEDVIKILEDVRFSPRFPSHLLYGLSRILGDKVRSMEFRLEKVTKVRNELDQLVSRAGRLPDPS